MLDQIFKKDKYVYIFISIVVLAIYANSLGNDFVSDDRSGILFNPQVGEWSYVFRSFIGFGNALTRLIIYHTFGLEAWAFRLFNIILHSGMACSVYYLFKNLYTKNLGLLTGFLFAVHPILTESITWIAGASYVTYGLLFLLSFIFFLESEDKYDWRYFLSLGLYAFAILTSEKAVSLAAIYILYKYIYSKESKASFFKAFSYMFVSIPFVILLYLTLGKRQEILATEYYQDSGLVNPFYQIPIAVTEYIQLFLWPQGLTLYHSETFYSYVEYFIRLGFFLPILFGCFYFIYKVRGSIGRVIMFWKDSVVEIDSVDVKAKFNDYKFFAFWFFFFIISMLPTLTPFKISWLVAERYAYLGVLGFVAIISYLFYKAIVRFVDFRITIVGLFIFILLALGIRTVYRNLDWYNEDTLWFATVKYSPSSPNIHNNLGDVYSRRGQLDKAVEEFKLAIQLKPNYADAYHNLALTYQTLWRQEQDEDIKSQYFKLAEQSYLQGIKFNPNLWQSHQNLALMYFEVGEIEKGYGEYAKAIQINPYDFNLLGAYVNVNLQLKNYVEAEKAALTLAELYPQNEEVKNVLVQIQALKANAVNESANQESN